MGDTGPDGRTTADGARRWLAAMPANVSGQRRVLESLISAAEGQPAFRWLELGGSLARGAGDELSDIDAGLGVADDSWAEGLAEAAAAARAASPVTDAFRQRFPGRDGEPGLAPGHAVRIGPAAQPGGHARLVASRAATAVGGALRPGRPAGAAMDAG